MKASSEINFILKFVLVRATIIQQGFLNIVLAVQIEIDDRFPFGFSKTV
jgi:hypothetical protein